MIRILVMITLTILIAWTPSTGRAATSMPVSDTISITADTMTSDPVTQSIEASGSVVLKWQGMDLTANRVIYDRNSRILTATGSVTIVKGDDILRGRSVSLNLESGRGELEQAQLNVPGANMTFRGEKIVRESEAEFTVTNTELTTCDLPDPSWKFGADQLKVNVLGYATGRNVIFYIKDTPVIYLPWIAFPVVRERKTGLLFPRFGYSKSRGAQADIPLYWVIAPNQDAQFNLDLQTRRGAGLGSLYRYIRTRGSEGAVGGYLIYDLVKDRWRGQISQDHKEIFSADMNLRTSVNLNSDRSFLGDFGEKSGEYNRQSSDTIVNALKTWHHFALTGHLRYVEDYYSASNSTTLQTLPEAGLAAVRLPVLRTPLRFDLDSTISNFQRESGPSGQRLHAFPRLSLSGGATGSVHLSAFAGLHLRGYTAQDTAGRAGSNDGSLLPETGARISTTLVRVYDTGGASLQKIRHELTPELDYRYIPDSSQNRLPFYDYTDRLIRSSTAWFSLTSTLGGKFRTEESTAYRDLSRIRLSQGYSFEGSRRDLLTMVDRQRPLTDLVLESETRLHDLARLTFDARWDHNRGELSTAMPGLEYDDRTGSFAGASYRMARNNLEYFEARLGTRRFRPWTFGYTTRYSFDRGDFLETVYTAEYRHQCWSVSLAVHDRPGNPSFSINFNLAGLTSSAGKQP